jgi:putative transposase
MQELGELPESLRELALTRFHLLQPHLEQGESLRSVAERAGLPLRTAGRWLAQYRRHGLCGLVRKGRKDRGERRAVSAPVQRVIEGLALERPPLPIRSVHRQARAFAERAGEPVPSYWMVRELVRALPAGLVTLAHQGGKAYSEAFDLVHRREATGPNAIWQADHTQLDILLLRQDGTAAKPWLTIVLDDYSRAVAGYYLAFDPPSTLRTALALRQAIWRKADARWPVCGIPHVLYTDNGSDFTSAHMEQVAADLKMQLVFSIPGKPRGRGRIERFFKTINDMFLSDLEGYLRRARRQPKMTLGQFEEQFVTFLLEVYHRSPTAEFAQAPIERWQSTGFLPRMPSSLEQLDLLLMQAVRTRKVRPDGIHFESLRYLSPTLAAYVGEEVTLRYDPRDVGEVRIFHHDKFLCRAVAAELAGDTASLREIIHARNRRRQQLRSVLRDRQQAVDSLLALRRGSVPASEGTQEEVHAKPPNRARPGMPGLKRYHNE